MSGWTAGTIAEYAYQGKVDRLGEPIALHASRVAVAVAEAADDWNRACMFDVALLHDAIEDGPDDVAYLIRQHCGRVVYRLVLTLTRTEGIGSYADYISVIANVPVARRIKLADLADNLDPARADGLTPSLRKRYEQAQARLEGEAVGGASSSGVVGGSGTDREQT